MNAKVIEFLRSRILKTGMLLALIGAVVASVGWSGKNQGRVKLGGTWVGRFGDITWTGTYAPDSSGQNAVLTLQWMTLSTDFQALMGSIGAQDPSMASGYMSMTGPNTANGEMLWYLLSPGTASATQPVAGTVKAIAVMTINWRFTSQGTAVGAHNLKMYFPNAQGSLLPEDGSLFFETDFEDALHQRIF